ncbi:MAG: hypothetical protein Q8O41_10335, partial [Candidatus Methanoperedens sp.]|nr:hypothetical protein [Candidatus Methanoperedens sp.]
MPEPAIPSRASGGRRHVCPAGIRGFPLPKGNRDADKRRFIEREDYNYAIDYGRKKGVKVFLSTPRIIKDIRDFKIFNFYSPQRTQRSQIEDDLDINPDGFLVSNLGVLYYLHRLDTVKPIIVDYPFNVFNRLAMEHLLN